MDQTDESEAKTFPVYLQVIQTAQGMPAYSAGFPLLLCQCFVPSPRVGSTFRSERMCTFVSAGHWSTGVCLDQLFLSLFLKICKSVIQMDHPNLNQVIKVQLSPQKFLKENLTDALEENLHVWVNHIYLAVLELTRCVFSPEDNFSGVESQLASQQTHFSSVFSKCILSVFFHTNRLMVPGSAPVHNGKSSSLLWLFF